MRAIWNGQLLAESDDTVVVEGNHYFPPESVDRRYFEESTQRSVCPWKGEAHYYDIVVNGERNTAAAWFYPDTRPKADTIRFHVAFWNGVEVSA